MNDQTSLFIYLFLNSVQFNDKLEIRILNFHKNDNTMFIMFCFSILLLLFLQQESMQPWTCEFTESKYY